MVRSIRHKMWVGLGMLLGVVVSFTAHANSAPALDTPSTAQQQAVYRIVMVLPRAEGQIELAFKEYFAKRGVALHSETIIHAGPAADPAALIAAIRAAQPDLIYTWGTPVTLAVAGRHDVDAATQARHIFDIPVVFTSVTDPVAAGVVSSIERPGRNVTGASHLAPLAVQLNTIAAYRPFQRLGFIYNPNESNAVLIRDALRAQLTQQGLSLLEEPVPLTAEGQPDAARLPQLVAQLKARGAEFLYIGPDTFVGFTHRERVTRAAVEHGLPSFSAIESPVRNAHALFGLFSPQANVGRFAAFKALRILQGEQSVAEEPIETLQHFSLLINMEVAQALALYPPLMLLNIADVLTEPRLNVQAAAPVPAPTLLPAAPLKP